MKYYSAIKKSEVMPFTETWMDLDIVMLSKEKGEMYDIPYVQSLNRNDTNELIKKQKQTKRTNLWLPGGRRMEGKGK